MRSSFSRSIFPFASLLTLASSAFLATPAFAQEPAPPLARPAAPPDRAAATGVTGEKTAAPAPVVSPAVPATAAQAAPPAPVASGPAVTVNGGYTCFVGTHPGIDDADAQTATDVLCHELPSSHAAAGEYEVRFGKLGGQILLVLASRSTGEERRILVTGVGEIPAVAPRLVNALVEHRTIESEHDVTNTTQAESRAVPLTPSAVSATLGIVAMSAAGVDAGASGGVMVGLAFRSDRWGVSATGRAGGIGSSGSKMGFADLDVGGRYYFSDATIAPFAEAGLALAYFQANRSAAPTLSGSGFGAYGQIGVEFMRAARTGAMVAVRADLPFYSLASETSSYSSQSAQASQSQYAVPLSLNLGISFH